MDGTAVADREDLSDLQLSPEERAEEAADRVRAEGGTPGAIEEARQQALAEAEQAALDGEDAAGDADAESVVMVPPDKLMVTGPAQGSTRRWKGKAPETVVLKIKGVEIEVPEGQFEKGERILFSGEALIVSEGVKDKLDKDTKTAVEAVQEHSAVVLDFELRDE